MIENNDCLAVINSDGSGKGNVEVIYVAELSDISLSNSDTTGKWNSGSGAIYAIESFAYTEFNWQEIRPNPDADNTYKQVHTDTEGVVNQTLTLSIHTPNTANLAFLQKLKNSCALCIIIKLKSNSKALVQGVDIVFTGRIEDRGGGNFMSRGTIVPTLVPATVSTTVTNEGGVETTILTFSSVARWLSAPHDNYIEEIR